MRLPLIVAAVAVSVVGLIPGGAGRAEAQSPAERQQMRELFLQRVADYVALHRDLEQSLPPQVVTSDPDALFAPQRALASAMRKTRAQARQGDIFTPGVAVYFRVTIAETLRREGVLEMMSIIEEENEVDVPPEVNGAYPAGRAIPSIPPCLLAALPELPPEVRYSVIGRYLILWDVHAGLIVDYVPRAVPIFTPPCP
jgi:hypothetical protein